MTIEIDGVNNTLKTDKIEPQSGTALQIGASGDTMTLPSGATLTIAGTINNTGTATGFGAIDWQTSDIKTSTFTAVAGKGYLVNTTGGAITVNLPAGSAGSLIGLVDYAGTWDSYACTVDSNGSEKIQGSTNNATLSADRGAVELLYVDSTQGWVVTASNDAAISQPAYITATGGTITTDGDYKVHTFTGNGTFAVTCAGNSAGSQTADWLVVAGGGGGAAGSPSGFTNGGGGAGGLVYQSGQSTLSASPGSYPITVGAGGAAASHSANSNNGSDTTFNSLTGKGGGSAGSNGSPIGSNGRDGGSGGGGSTAPGPSGATRSGGSGTQPSQPGVSGSAGFGNAGGGFANVGGCPGRGGGGGGAGGAGVTASGSTAQTGGAGKAYSITGSSVTYAAGGYGGGDTSPNCASTANSGNGANGGAYNSGSRAGGDGVVIIRYKFQN